MLSNYSLSRPCSSFVRRNIICIISIAIFFLLFLLLLIDYAPKNSKSTAILEGSKKISINGHEKEIKELARNTAKSWSSVLEMDCKFPIIEPEELDIKEYVHKYRSINCISQMPNLASFDIDTHKLIIHNELEPYRQWSVPEFRCYYRGIGGGLSPSISNFDWLGEEVQVTQDEEVDIPYDQFVVICRNATPTVYVNDKPRLNNSVIYERAFAGFVNSSVSKENFAHASEDSPSLSILVLDSIARTQFLRHMPKTVEMMKRLGFIWLDGYTKVGDNSAVNLLPVLAGKSILPKVGQSDESEFVPNGTIVNLEETVFLWDIMKRKNCVTLFNDDILDIRRGLFHYPNDTFIGFKKTPTDYYFRAYHLYNPKKMFYPKAGGQCMKTGQVTTEEYLDIWEKFSTIYKDKCHFSFNFFTELTHDEPSNLGAIDIRMRTSLERMLVNGIFNTTAFVIMGDHGNRISHMQRTYVGRIEERTPFFSVYLPDNFRRKNQALMQNFEYNRQRLSSNFDIHQTLRFIAGLGSKDTWSAKMPNRGINLLTNRILTNRTCAEAGIAQNFCLCMEKKNISRLGIGSKEYIEVELLLQKQLEPIKCLQTSSLKIVDDKLTPLVLNQMVRHGLRNQTDWPKVQHIQAAMEIFFFDVNAVIQTVKNKDLSVLARVKHYIKEFRFFLATDPIATFDLNLTEDNTNKTYINLSDVCKIII